MAKEQKCRECGAPLKYVEDVDPEFYGVPGSSSKVTVPLASKIYECEQHGLWRIYINDVAEKVVRRP